MCIPLLEAGEFFDARFGESRAYKEYVKDLYYLFEQKKKKRKKKKANTGKKFFTKAFLTNETMSYE